MGFAKSKVNVIKEKLKVLKTVESKRLDYEYIECPEYKKNNIIILPFSLDGYLWSAPC